MVVNHRPAYKPRLLKSIWKHRTIYTLLIPGLVWYLIFAYGPMGGLSLAFKTYKAKLGIWMSPWAGLDNYVYVFRDPAFIRSIWRTLTVNLGRIVFTFPVPIVIALLLNELRYARMKRIVQTVLTFPNFLSWVVVSSIMITFFASDGPVNMLISRAGGETINFLGNNALFIPMVYFTDIWKSAGWSAIIYLAAISGIDQDQYEAAEIDGASRLQRMTRITLPNIMPTVVVMFILSMGNVMSAGFDQIFNLSNAAVRDTAEILDMYIYRVTFQSAPDFSFSMAVSLFRSVINMLLLLITDRGAKMMGGEGLLG